MRKTDKITLGLLGLALGLLPCLRCAAQTDRPDLWADDPDRQYVNWTVTGSVIGSNYFHDLSAMAGEPLRLHMGVGIGLGGVIDYHVLRHWGMRFAVEANVESVVVDSAAYTNALVTYGSDVAVEFYHRRPLGGGNLLLGAGPYARFIFGCTPVGDGHMDNPYTRIVDFDSLSGREIRSMSDFSAGISLTVLYETATRWDIALNARLAVTDILNVATPRTYMIPYKLALQIGYRF